MVDQGLRRTDQIKADRLLITAAIAINSAGSITSMGLASYLEPIVYWLFPIRNRQKPINRPAFNFSGEALLQR